MKVKIALPSVTRATNAKAHSFPIQVSFQAQEFMFGAMFHAMVGDVASGEYVRLPNGLKLVEGNLKQKGLSDKNWETGWNILQKYMPVFEHYVLQSALVQVRSHWDWYIRQLGEFIRFARNHVTSPILDRKQQKALDYVDRKEIKEQLSILETATGITFNLPVNVMDSVEEMSLVRNLGLHNRWEVDRFYLSKTSKPGYEVGEIRFIEVSELQDWVTSLTSLLHETCFPVAEKYVSVPDYP